MLTKYYHFCKFPACVKCHEPAGRKFRAALPEPFPKRIWCYFWGVANRPVRLAGSASPTRCRCSPSDGKVSIPDRGGASGGCRGSGRGDPGATFGGTKPEQFIKADLTFYRTKPVVRFCSGKNKYKIIGTPGWACWLRIGCERGQRPGMGDRQVVRKAAHTGCKRSVVITEASTGEEWTARSWSNSQMEFHSISSTRLPSGSRTTLS
jgi:hypothetical protein